MATGYERQPFIPPWPGRDRFAGGCSCGRLPRPRPVPRLRRAGGGVGLLGHGGRLRPGRRWRPAGAGVGADPAQHRPALHGRLPATSPPWCAAAAATRGDSQVRVCSGSSWGSRPHGLPMPPRGVHAAATPGGRPDGGGRQVVQAIRDRRIRGERPAGSEPHRATLADGTRVEPDSSSRRPAIAGSGGVGRASRCAGRARHASCGRGARASAGLRFVGFVPRPGQPITWAWRPDGPPAPSPASCAGRRRPTSRPQSIANGRQGPRPR